MNYWGHGCWRSRVFGRLDALTPAVGDQQQGFSLNRLKTGSYKVVQLQDANGCGGTLFAHSDGRQPASLRKWLLGPHQVAIDQNTPSIAT